MKITHQIEALCWLSCAMMESQTVVALHFNTYSLTTGLSTVVALQFNT